MHTKTTPLHQRLPRLTGWLILSLLLCAIVFAISPQQLPVSIYKLSLIAIAAVVGYWIDRSVFDYARPHIFFPQIIPPIKSEPIDWVAGEESICECEGSQTIEEVALACVSMLRRAIIVGCAMLAMGLGA